MHRKPLLNKLITYSYLPARNGVGGRERQIDRHQKEYSKKMSIFTDISMT